MENKLYTDIMRLSIKTIISNIFKESLISKSNIIETPRIVKNKCYKAILPPIKKEKEPSNAVRLHHSWISINEKQRLKEELEAKVAKSKSFSLKMELLQRKLKEKKDTERIIQLEKALRKANLMNVNKLTEIYHEKKTIRSQKRKEEFLSKRRERMAKIHNIIHKRNKYINKSSIVKDDYDLYNKYEEIANKYANDVNNSIEEDLNVKSNTKKNKEIYDYKDIPNSHMLYTKECIQSEYARILVKYTKS